MVQVNRVCLNIIFINRPQSLVDSNDRILYFESCGDHASTARRREISISPFLVATPLLRFFGRGTGEGEGRGVTGSQSLSAVTGGEETVWGRNSVLVHRLFKLEP